MDKALLSSEFWANAYEQSLAWIINNVPSIILLIIIFLIAIRLINVSIRKFKKMMMKRQQRTDAENAPEAEKRINTVSGIFRGFAIVTLWVVFLMILLKKLGIDIGPLLAGAGIVGLAIGFGAQELVRDLISGFFILLEDRLRTGDVAIINGTGGLVESIELREIVLRDLSGVVHVFQNGKINTLSNMTKDWSAMVFDIGVAYKEDTDEVSKVIKEVADELQKDPELGKNILEPIEIFGVDSFGDSAVVIKARIKTKPITQWTVGREYRRRLKKAFDEKGIEIPFPHQTIYWGEEITPLELVMKDKSKQN